MIILLQGGGRYHPHTSSSKAQQQGGRSPALSLVSGSGRASRRGSSRRSPLASPGAGGGGGGHYPPDLVGISEPGVKPTQDNSDRWGYTVKNGYRFSRPQPGCHKTNSPWTGIFKLFPARESLVSDIPAGDGKNDNLFYSVYVHYVQVTLSIG
jgi:hypothetical protein